MSYKVVPAARTYGPTGLGKAGAAMSAFGGMLTGLAGNLQGMEDRKANDELSKAMEEELSKVNDMQMSSSMLSEPASVTTMDMAKLKPLASVDEGGEVQSALTSGIEPGLMPTQGTQTEAQGSSMLPTSTLNQPTAPNPAMVQRATIQGLMDIQKTVPPDVYKNALQSYQRIAAAAAKAKKPEIVIHFLDKQLEFLKNEYGADTKMSLLALKGAMDLLKQEKGIEGQKEIVGLKGVETRKTKGTPGAPKAGAIPSDEASLLKELGTQRSRVNDAANALNKARNAMTIYGSKEEKTNAISKTEKEYNDALGRLNKIQQRLDELGGKSFDETSVESGSTNQAGVGKNDAASLAKTKTKQEISAMVASGEIPFEVAAEAFRLGAK